MSIPLLERLIADAWLHQQRCQGCRDCLVICPVVDETTVAAGGLLRAMEAPEAMTPAERRFAADCTLCGQCVPACPTGARRDVMTHALSSPPFPARSRRGAGFRAFGGGTAARSGASTGEPAPGTAGTALGSPACAAHSGCCGSAPPPPRPRLAVSLYDFCGLLAEELSWSRATAPQRTRLDDRHPSSGAGRPILEICRETGAYEIICAEDLTPSFSLVLGIANPPSGPRRGLLAGGLAGAAPAAADLAG
ncbi:4Fe-4S dicluster domain-containing protein [bacterium]|nr:4Fe-4S dicluster domain-containing protein [bacterium]